MQNTRTAAHISWRTWHSFRRTTGQHCHRVAAPYLGALQDQTCPAMFTSNIFKNISACLCCWMYQYRCGVLDFLFTKSILWYSKSAKRFSFHWGCQLRSLWCSPELFIARQLAGEGTSYLHSLPVDAFGISFLWTPSKIFISLWLWSGAQKTNCQQLCNFGNFELSCWLFYCVLVLYYVMDVSSAHTHAQVEVVRIWQLHCYD